MRLRFSYPFLVVRGTEPAHACESLAGMGRTRMFGGGSPQTVVLNGTGTPYNFAQAESLFARRRAFSLLRDVAS